MKNILVTGSNGMLGYAVSEYYLSKGYNVKKINRDDFDIAKHSFDKFIPFLDGIDLVINCAGVIKPRIKDMTFEDVLKVNAIFPQNLAKTCNEKDIKMIHITTDCVYTGLKGKYNENDVFDADDIYGMTKNAGEPSEYCMVLRTSIIGEELREGRSLLEWAKSEKGNKVNGFTNHRWNGVTTLYLAEIIEKIIIKDLYQKGLFHIHSPNSVDKYELLKILDNVYQLNLEITPVEAGTFCDRSMISNKDLASLVSNKTITEQVKEMKDFFSRVEK